VAVRVVYPLVLHPVYLVVLVTEASFPDVATIGSHWVFAFG